MQTGNGWERIEEDRTNFGALAITSSPLILGMDVTNAKALANAGIGTCAGDRTCNEMLTGLLSTHKPSR